MKNYFSRSFFVLFFSVLGCSNSKEDPQKPELTLPTYVPPATAETALIKQKVLPKQKPVCLPDGWCWQSPVLQGNRIAAVWAASEKDVWAVGETGTLLHYDGDAWIRFAPPAGKEVSLYGIWGSASDDIWVFGENKTLLHWNGKTWKEPASKPQQTLNTIQGIDSTHVWAIGGETNALFFWNGSVWSSIPTVWGSAGLMRLSVSSANNIWVYGSLTEDSKKERQIFRFDGNSWISIPVPGPVKMEQPSLYNLGFSMQTIEPNDTWLVMQPPHNAFEERVFHWDGKTWNRENLLGPISTSHPLEIRLLGGDANDIWLTDTDPLVNTYLRHKDRTGWHTIAIPRTTQYASNTWRINALFSQNGVTWFVGRDGLLVEYKDGIFWQHAGPLFETDPASTASNINPSKWVDVNDSLKIGISSTGVVQSCATGWCGEYTSPDIKLNDMWLSPDKTVWVVGGTHSSETGKKKALVLHRDAAGIWQKMDVGTNELYRLIGFSANDIWVGGEQGQLLHYNGTDWATTALPLKTPPGYSPEIPPVAAIWGTASNDLWVIGGASVFHYDGTSWDPSSPSTTSFWYGLWGTSTTDIWIAGPEAVFHWDGFNWEQHHLKGMQAYNIGGTGASDVWVLGRGATPGSLYYNTTALAHWDGHGWTYSNFIEYVSDVKADDLLGGTNIFLSDHKLWAACRSFAIYRSFAP